MKYPKLQDGGGRSHGSDSDSVDLSNSRHFQHTGALFTVYNSNPCNVDSWITSWRQPDWYHVTTEKLERLSMICSLCFKIMWNVPTRIFNAGNPQIRAPNCSLWNMTQNTKIPWLPMILLFIKYKAKPSSNWNPFRCLQVNVGNLETIHNQILPQSNEEAMKWRGNYYTICGAVKAS